MKISVLSLRSLFAFLILASASHSALATSDVVYFGLQNIAIPTNFAGVYINVDQGTTAFAEFTGWDINPFFGGTAVASSPSFLPARTGTGNEDAIVALAAGAMVDGSLNFSTGYGGSQTHMGGGMNQFQPGQEAYLGFKFTTDANDGPHYGWMRVVFGNTGGVVKDWAYENGTSGANPAAIQTGNILQAAPVSGVSIVTVTGTGASTLGSALNNVSGGVTALTKNGSGSWTMAGTKTYTGATTVNAGVLEVAGKLSGTSGITVNNGGTLLLSGSGGMDSKLNNAAPITLAGGTVNLSGMSSSLTQTVGALTLTANSILNFGTLLAGNTLRFGASNADWSGLQLAIYNYSGGADHLFFGSNNSALDPSQLGQILFYSDNGSDFLGTGQFIGDGELAPVPEPATYLTGIAAALTLARFAYRRFRSRRVN